MITSELSPSLRSVDCIYVFLQIFREVKSFATDMTPLHLHCIDVAMLLRLVRFEREDVFGSVGADATLVTFSPRDSFVNSQHVVVQDRLCF